jgi:hypothetical protein
MTTASTTTTTAYRESRNGASALNDSAVEQDDIKVTQTSFGGPMMQTRVEERASEVKEISHKQYQSAHVELYEEIESIALQPIGKGVHDLTTPTNRTMTAMTTRSNVTLNNGPPTSAKPTAFIEQDIEVVTLQPIGKGVRDLENQASRRQPEPDRYGNTAGTLPTFKTVVRTPANQNSQQARETLYTQQRTNVTNAQAYQQCAGTNR